MNSIIGRSHKRPNAHTYTKISAGKKVRRDQKEEHAESSDAHLCLFPSSFDLCLTLFLLERQQNRRDSHNSLGDRTKTTLF